MRSPWQRRTSLLLALGLVALVVLVDQERSWLGLGLAIVVVEPVVWWVHPRVEVLAARGLGLDALLVDGREMAFRLPASWPRSVAIVVNLTGLAVDVMVPVVVAAAIGGAPGRMVLRVGLVLALLEALPLSGHEGRRILDRLRQSDDELTAHLDVRDANWAGILVLAGRADVVDEAVALHRDALERASDDHSRASLANNLACCCIAVDRDDLLELADRMSTLALELEPDQGGHRDTRGRVLVALDRPLDGLPLLQERLPYLDGQDLRDSQAWCAVAHAMRWQDDAARWYLAAASTRRDRARWPRTHPALAVPGTDGVDNAGRSDGRAH